MSKFTLVAAVALSLAGTSAFAAPSSYTASVGRAADREAQFAGRRDEQRPYRLTGTKHVETKRVVQYRQVPTGRGESQLLPFYVNVPVATK